MRASMILESVATLTLIAPFIGAATLAFVGPATRFAADAARAVTASGVAAPGIGAAFWGLVAGLVVHGTEETMRRIGPRRSAGGVARQP